MTDPIIAHGRRVAPRHADSATRFNDRLALRITAVVGTMACAYAFTAIALISLPGAVSTHDPVVIVAWLAQTFLQLVLLSIIMVSQNISAKAGDARAKATAEHVDAILVGQASLHDTVTNVLTEVAVLRTEVTKPKSPARPRPVKVPPAP